MPELIRNPRVSPRVPIGCTARIALRAGSFVATTVVDVGPGGFGVELPWRPEPGERVFVELAAPKMSGSHLLTGQVAWTSEAAPWRCGIAFDGASARAAAGLFGEIAGAYPDLTSQAQLVEGIPGDAVLAPAHAAAPDVPDALAPAEAEVLRLVGSGVEAGTLRERLGERWASAANALFALLSRGAVEIRRR